MYTENLRNWVYLLGQTLRGVYRDYALSFDRAGRSIAMFIRNYGWQLPRGALIVNDDSFFSICRTSTNLFLSNFIGESLQSNMRL